MGSGLMPWGGIRDQLEQSLKIEPQEYVKLYEALPLHLIISTAIGFLLNLFPDFTEICESLSKEKSASQ